MKNNNKKVVFTAVAFSVILALACFITWNLMQYEPDTCAMQLAFHLLGK